MGRKCASVFDNIANTTATTRISLISAATVQPKLYDFSIGASGASTPADQACNYKVQRFSVDGTGTAFAPIVLDPNGGTVLATSKVNYTVEPTLTAAAFLLEVGLNMRATFRWIANPGGELIAPSAAGNGLALLSVSPSAAYNICGYMHWDE